MRILLTSIGSSGDINPFIALGRELTARGHEATMLANPCFASTIMSAGLGFEPLGEALDPVQVAREMPLCFSRSLGAYMLITRWFAPLVPVLVERAAAAARACRADLLVGHQISFGLPWAARELGLPWATCVLSPGTMLSREDPSKFPLGADLHKMPMWYRRFANWSARSVLNLMLDPPMNAHRKARGESSRGDVFWGEMFEGAAALGLWSPALRPRAADDPPNFRVCGFPWHDRTASYGQRGQRLDERIERFLDEGDPPVVFTLGSVLSHDARREFDVAARVCARLKVRGVLVTGNDGAAPGVLPPGVMAVDYAPYSALMPRAAATVHHGGVGTTAQAMRAGKPMVIMPFAHDQFDHAARLERAGSAVWLPKGRLSVKSMSRAVERLLSDRGMQHNASLLGEQVRSENGVGAAADALESIPH